MSEIIKLLLFVVFGLFMLFMGMSIQEKTSICPDCVLQSRCPDVTCEKTECPDCVLTNVCPSQSHLDEIAANIANEQEYRDNYNCDEFSRELVRRYADAGYLVSYCEGYIIDCGKPNCRHAWVKVETYYEATNGIQITPDVYQEQYKEEFCSIHH